MTSFVKLVYLIIVLNIATDFISLGGYLFDSGARYDSDTSPVQSSLLLPGAHAAPIGPVLGIGARILAGALSRSAKKAARKQAKNTARVEGNRRNKAKKAGGNEHTKNARKSTRNKHEKNQARQQREQNRGKKG